MSRLARGFAAMSGWAAGNVSSAVLMREASRTSRRWQTYAARLGVSGVMIGGLLLAIWVAVNAPFADPANLGWLGRGLFVGVATLLFGMASMLAPLQAAAALIEETDQGTLDLLVLTKLRSHQIAGAKVLSRVLVLLTLVFGTLPVMATVVTLGGVSGTEVIAVTLHTALTVLLAGAMGALFSLFTRSPMLAMVAAAGYAIPAYVVLPSAYAVLAVSPRGVTHLSLMAGPFAEGADALLPLVVHLPVVWMTWRIGTKLFALRTSRAHLRHAFSAELWESRRFFRALALFLVGSCFALPLLAVPLWTLTAAKASAGFRLPFQAGLFAWCTFGTWLVAWTYLRVGVDVVDAIDRTFGNRASDRRPPVRVWGNPVAWREARPRAWGESAVPIQFTWILGLMLLSQSALWIVPGGLVGLGLFNLVAAVVLTLWLATWSIESERRAGTLDVLVTTTMPAWRITWGKVAGILVPTAPLVLLSLPMLVLGNLWANSVLSVDGGVLDWLGRSLGTWAWAVEVWLLSLGVGLIAALTSPKRPAFALSLGLVGAALGVPAAAGRLFPDTWWIAGPARLIAPPLAGHPAWWQLVGSIAAVGVLGLVAYAGVVWNLRRWVAGAVALALVALAPPAHAQNPKDLQDGFLFRVVPLNDGIGREDEWTALQVGILNAGPRATATIAIEERAPGETTSIPYRRVVELPEGAHKELILLVRPGIAGRERIATLDATARHAEDQIRWQHVGDEDVVLGVIGDDPLGLTAVAQAWTGPVPARRARTMLGEGPRRVRAGLLSPALLPRHAAAYQAIDQIVWPAADPTQIGGRELDALLDWVAAGGHLTLTVTDSWPQVADSPLGAALPVDLVGSRDAADLEALAVAAGIAGDVTGPTPQALAVPRANADRGTWVVAQDPDGYALWSVGTFGLGTITVLAADPGTQPLASHRLALWRGLLWLPEPGSSHSTWQRRHERARAYGGDPEFPLSLVAAQRTWDVDAVECYWSTGWQDFASWDMNDAAMAWEQQIRDRLAEIPGASPLPLSWLIAFSIAYLLAIGPIDYAVLRWLRKEPWTWATFPLTVLVFSGVALVGTAYTKGSEAVVTRVEVVDVLPGTDRWRGQDAIGVWATRKVSLALTSGAVDGVVQPLKDAGFISEVAVYTDEGPGRMTWRAETWTLGYVRSSWVEAGHGRMRIVRTDAGRALENGLGVDLAQVVLVEGDPTGRNAALRMLDLGPLGAGERAPFGETSRWTANPPGPDDMRWVWRVLREHPDAFGAHLHAGSWPRYVIAIAEEPVEDVALSGLSPVEKHLTVFRVPLGAPTAPIAGELDFDDP